MTLVPNPFYELYLPTKEEWEAKVKRTRELMATWPEWPEQHEEHGIYIVSHPEMGTMAISPRYGHPVNVRQARAELAEMRAEQIIKGAFT